MYLITNIKNGDVKMGRTLTEQKVLKKLGIEDFRHLSKDNHCTEKYSKVMRKPTSSVYLQPKDV